MKKIAILIASAILLLAGCKKAETEVYVMTQAEALESVVGIWIGDEHSDTIQFNEDLSGSWVHDDGIEIISYTVTPQQDGTATILYTYDGGKGTLVLPEKGSKILTTLNGLIYRK